MRMVTQRALLSSCVCDFGSKADDMWLARRPGTLVLSLQLPFLIGDSGTQQLSGLVVGAGLQRSASSRGGRHQQVGSVVSL